MAYTLDKNGPIIASKLACAVALNGTAGRFNVASISYDGIVRIFAHRTKLAAFRRLSSVCAGKLHKRDEFAAVIVTPEMACMNWREAKAELRA